MGRVPRARRVQAAAHTWVVVCLAAWGLLWAGAWAPPLAKVCAMAYLGLTLQFVGSLREETHLCGTNGRAIWKATVNLGRADGKHSIPPSPSQEQEVGTMGGQEVVRVQSYIG